MEIIPPPLPRHPWMALICSQYQQDLTDSSGTSIKCGQFCGGALVSNDHVITSSSCLSRADINNTVVFLGVTSVQDALMSLDYLFISEIHLHPDSSHGDTVAMIKLENRVNFSSTVNKISLPETFESYQDGDEALIAGWQEGNSQNGDTTDERAVIIKSEEHCIQQFQNKYIQK